MSTKTAIILVNFGGPRSLSEIGPFLTELLTDVDVIRTPLPRFFDRWFFKRVALKRVAKVAKDYELIGGKSPLFRRYGAGCKSAPKSSKTSRHHVSSLSAGNPRPIYQ